MIPEEIRKQLPADPEAFKLWLEENYREVVAPTKLELTGVSTDDTLQRFIDLPKLFTLLKSRSLFLPRLKQLIKGDPFECYCQKNYDHLDRPELETLAKQLELYAPDEAKGTIFPPEITNVWAKIGHGKPLFDHQIQKMPIEDLKKAVWYLERERLKNDLVCCCWYKGKGESDAMWKIYATQLGVMFTTSPARIEKATQLVLPKIYLEFTKLKLAAVHYKDTEDCGNDDPWLIKREAFRHEQEVRLYCENAPIGFKVEVNLPDFIEKIVITPFAKPWELAGIEEAIKTLLKAVGADVIPVEQSKHMRPPEINWPKEQKTLAEALSGVVRPSLMGNLFSQKGKVD